jgi:hypothetical protein
MLSKAKCKTVEKKLTRDVHEQTHKNTIHALQSKSVNKNCRDKKTKKTIMCKKTNAHKTSKTPTWRSSTT